MMVGAACAVTLGHISLEQIDHALEWPGRVALLMPPTKALFPVAPAAGLILKDSGYDRIPRMAVATDEKDREVDGV